MFRQNYVSRTYQNVNLVFKRSTSGKFDKVIPERLRPFWNHPAGPQTIFFWAPIFKWGLVIAGLADLKRDPATISTKTPISLFMTGIIWSRYSFAIIPKNYLLFSVNFFVALTQLIQLYRVYEYNKNLK